MVKLEFAFKLVLDEELSLLLRYDHILKAETGIAVSRKIADNVNFKNNHILKAKTGIAVSRKIIADDAKVWNSKITNSRSFSNLSGPILSGTNPPAKPYHPVLSARKNIETENISQLSCIIPREGKQSTGHRAI